MQTESPIRPPRKHRRHWLRLAWRCLLAVVRDDRRSADLIRSSYDRIASGYDGAWTQHMRDLSLEMVQRLSPAFGERCIDLTCGTGFVTAQLARRTGSRVIGVDASHGMLDIARGQCGRSCTFFQADALCYLRSQPRGSADVITCAWGLGYTRPAALVREVARVLRPGGRVGIIDNSLFSLAGVMWASLQAFAESPNALTHALRVRFLPHSTILATIMRVCGLAVLHHDDGARSYDVPDGNAAIARLTATGAAAGFEFASAPHYRDQIFARFAEIMDHTSRSGDSVRITHRWLMAIGARQ